MYLYPVYRVHQCIFVFCLFQTVEEHQSLSFSHIVKQWRRTVVEPEGSVMRTSLLKYFCPKKGLYVNYREYYAIAALLCYSTTFSMFSTESQEE